MNGKIYCITNLVDGKYYIGQTIQPIKKRFGRHLHESKKRISHLYLSMRKHSVGNFVIETLMDNIQSHEELNELEKLWIALTNATNKKFGLNNHAGGNKPPIGIKATSFSKGHVGFGRGIPRTEEVKRKVSQAQIGKIISEETRKRQSKAQLGKTIPTETRKKISDSLRGRRTWNYGKTLTEETKKRMRDAQRKRRDKEKLVD